MIVELIRYVSVICFIVVVGVGLILVNLVFVRMGYGCIW